MPELISFSRQGVPSEVSKDFIIGMIDRMTVSFHKYGRVSDGYEDGAINAVASLQERLELYLEDGNTEWLIDVANFAMIEFMFPSHPSAYFAATDSNKSPGRVRFDGRQTKVKNLDVDPPVGRKTRRRMDT